MRFWTNFSPVFGFWAPKLGRSFPEKWFDSSRPDLLIVTFLLLKSGKAMSGKSGRSAFRFGEESAGITLWPCNSKDKGFFNTREYCLNKREGDSLSLSRAGGRWEIRSLMLLSLKEIFFIAFGTVALPSNISKKTTACLAHQIRLRNVKFRTVSRSRRTASTRLHPEHTKTTGQLRLSTVINDMNYIFVYSTDSPTAPLCGRKRWKLCKHESVLTFYKRKVALSLVTTVRKPLLTHDVCVRSFIPFLFPSISLARLFQVLWFINMVQTDVVDGSHPKKKTTKSGNVSRQLEWSHDRTNDGLKNPF